MWIRYTFKWSQTAAAAAFQSPQFTAQPDSLLVNKHFLTRHSLQHTHARTHAQMKTHL